MTKRKHSIENSVADVLKKAKRYVLDQGLVEGVPENDRADESEEEPVKRKASETDLQRKKERKRMKKLQREQQKSGAIDTGPTSKLGLDYLRQWHTNRDNWKFQKSRQNWLMKNAFDLGKLCDEDFTVALEYFASMKGIARDTIQSKALVIVKKHDEERDDETNEETEDESKIYSRAREIIQIMA